jgi:putative DNA methylase
LIVVNALKHFDNSRYFLGEFVVMPNHVNLIITPNNNFNLSDILHTLKSFTAKEMNKLMGKKGAIWQKEYFDHIIRSPKHLEKYNEYILSHKK